MAEDEEYQLDQMDRLAIVLACIFILIIAFSIVVCKLSPSCWCHNLACIWKADYKSKINMDSLPSSSGSFMSSDFQKISPTFTPSYWKGLDLDLDDDSLYAIPEHYQMMPDIKPNPKTSYNTDSGEKAPLGILEHIKTYDSISNGETVEESLDTVQPPVNLVIRGELYFTIRWDEDLNQLVLKIIEAKNLQGNAPIPPKAVRIRLQLIRGNYPNVPPSKTFSRQIPKIITYGVQSKIVKDCVNPQFNDRFVIPPIAMEGKRVTEFSIRALSIAVYKNQDPEVIGECTISLDNKDFANRCHVNEILLAPYLEPKGALKVALNYMPTAEKLQIYLKDCTHLKTYLDEGKSTDFCIKIAVIYKGDSILKKRSKSYQCQSDIVLNDAFNFDIPRSRINAINVVIAAMQIIHPEPKSNLGKCKVKGLGKCLLGLGGLPNSIVHWNEMLQNPRNHVEKEHFLRG